MLTDRPLLQIAFRHLPLLALGGALGALFGQLFAGLFAATLISLAWHLSHLAQLYRWLNESHRRPPPAVADGVWSDLYQRFYSLELRNRKRKRKLNRVLKRFRSGVAALPAGIVILNDEHQVEWCNRSACTMLGLSAPQDYGTPITSLVRSPAMHEFLSLWPSEDNAVISPSHDADLQLRVRLVKFGKKQRLLLATDISAALALARSRRDFVANASHELRTPLTVLVGYLETMGDQPVFSEPPWQQPLLHMQAQAQRMQHIVNDLLLLSNLETDASDPPKQSVAVPSILREIARDAAALSGEGSDAHRIELDVDPELWLLGGDRELHSAFANLAFNAVKHTPPGTRIVLRWGLEGESPVYSVNDQGDGIAPQHLPRLSERFYRVDRSRRRADDGGGTGLGLAIVKHVAQRHGGSLQIDSRVGVGSCFSCRFPPARAAAANTDGNKAGAANAATA